MQKEGTWGFNPALGGGSEAGGPGRKLSAGGLGGCGAKRSGRRDRYNPACHEFWTSAPDTL